MKSNSIQKTLPRLTKLMVLLLILLILPVNIFLQLYLQHQSQEESSQEMFGQLEQLIQTSQSDLEYSKEEFSESVIRSADAVAYFTAMNPDIPYNLEASRELAQKLDIDEIHFFNKEGEIFGGTLPKYYGFTFNSGEQMQFFLPMLKDKDLKLCQDITPNTAEQKNMQYAAVWMDDGSMIVQVGMEPRRLMEKIEEKDMDNLLTSMPFDLRGHLHVVDKNTSKMIASTDKSLIGRSFDEQLVNQYLSYTKENDEDKTFHVTYKGTRYCVYLHSYEDKLLIRTYLSKYPVIDVFRSTLLVLLYIGLAAIAVIGIIHWYVNRKLVNNLTNIIDNLQKVGMGDMENITLATDITEYNQLVLYVNEMLSSLRLNWNRISYLINNSQFPVGILAVNSFYKKSLINGRILELLGIETTMSLEAPETIQMTKEVLAQILSNEVNSSEQVYKHNSNDEDIFLRIEVIEDEQSITHYVTDVSTWWNELDSIKEESNLDFLTKLYNRRGFHAIMGDKFYDPDSLGLGLMLMIDADNLKKINDIYGHHIGDEYLRAIARELKKAAGSNAICARLGGDEFAVFIYGYHSKYAILEIYSRISAKRGLKCAPANTDIVVSLEFSIGTALYPDESTNFHKLMQIADKKMYEEKKQRAKTIT